MRIHSLMSINRNQKGFTLIELLVTIAIASIIAGGLATAFLQTFVLNTHDTNHITVIRQVQSAGHWLSQDAMMAHTFHIEDIDDPDTPEHELIILSRWDWSNDLHEITYSIVDGELKRTHEEDGVEISVTTVAQYIDSDETSCEFVGRTLFLTVTASIGGWQPVSESRVYELSRRSEIWWSF